MVAEEKENKGIMWKSNQQGHGDQLDEGFRGEECPSFPACMDRIPAFLYMQKENSGRRPRLKTWIPILKMLS